MSKLKQLVGNLQDMIARSDPILKQIRSPRLLLKYLRELDSMIGNGEVKESIASQVSYLLAVYDPNTDQDPALNTVLYGPPGTGKTSIGVALAKIWYALGYIGQSNSESVTVTNIFSGGDEASSAMLNIYLILIVIFILYSMLSPLIRYVYQTVGWMYFLIGTVILIIVVVLWCLYSYFTSSHSSSVTTTVKRTPKPPTATGKPAQGQDLPDLPELRDLEAPADLVRVVGREDFIDKYMGGTDKKTKSLLVSSLGKVLVVDECYSLMSGPQDMYGQECLATMVRFMSEHQGQIVIIFCGYQDLIEKMFKVQPGLCRRFSWYHTCSGYSGVELFNIFRKQLGHTGWSIAKEDLQQVEELFDINSDIFPYFGGDTEKLTHFAKLEYSDEVVSGVRLLKKTLTAEQISRALEVLRVNNNSSQGEEEEESVEQLQQMLSAMKTKGML